MDYSNEIRRLMQVYTSQYPTQPDDTNYPWHPRNPVSLYYRQAQQRGIIELLRSADLALEKLKVLDIGCGAGYHLSLLSHLGAEPVHLQGLDLMFERLQTARKLSPSAIIYCQGDGQHLPYPSRFFDLVCQFTVFSSIFDLGLRRAIAAEIDRVLQPHGWLLWYDMYRSISKHTRPIERHEIAQLFPGFEFVHQCELHSRWISRLAPRSFLLCTLVDHLPGMRKTHLLCLLRKSGGSR